MTEYKRKCIRCIDGDTFEIDEAIDGIKRIRLAYVNTPEMDEKGYDKMTRYLEKLILGKQVKLKIVGKNEAKMVNGHRHQARYVAETYYGLFYKNNASERIKKKMNSFWSRLTM